MVRKSGSSTAGRRHPPVQASLPSDTPSASNSGSSAPPSLPFGALKVAAGVNGINGALKKFGIEECPQCKVSFDFSNSRPVQDSCGHFKCRPCLISNDDGCPQCKEKEKEKAPPRRKKNIQEDTNKNNDTKTNIPNGNHRTYNGSRNSKTRSAFSAPKAVAPVPALNALPSPSISIIPAPVGESSSSFINDTAKTNGNLRAYSPKKMRSSSYLVSTPPPPPPVANGPPPTQSPNNNFIKSPTLSNETKSNGGQRVYTPIRNPKLRTSLLAPKQVVNGPTTNTTLTSSSTSIAVHPPVGIPSASKMDTMPSNQIENQRFYGASTSKAITSIPISSDFPFPRYLAPAGPALLVDPPPPPPSSSMTSYMDSMGNGTSLTNMQGLQLITVDASEINLSIGSYPAAENDVKPIDVKPTDDVKHSIPSGEASAPPTEKKKKKRNPVIIHPHITVISGDPTMFQCNVCMKKFKTKAHIKYHEFCNNGTKPFKCEQCGQGFIAKSHYEYHLRTHTGERPYVCPKCGKGFNQRGKVTRHMRSHTGEKPFICSECGRGFANAQALRSHHLIHTGERPFACKYCQKRFTGMTNLKKHIITHTGERPYVCTHCGKSFGLKWTLDLHLRTHSSERPYACEQCTRAFSNSKDLRRHLVIHSGERPFKCWICGTAFRRKDNLDRHIKNTHNQPKEIAKQLANEAAAEYLAINKNAPVPVSKVNSAVISNVIRTAHFSPIVKNSPPRASELSSNADDTRQSSCKEEAIQSDKDADAQLSPPPQAPPCPSPSPPPVIIAAELSSSRTDDVNMKLETYDAPESYILPDVAESTLGIETQEEEIYNENAGVSTSSLDGANNKVRTLAASDCGLRIFDVDQLAPILMEDESEVRPQVSPPCWEEDQHKSQCSEASPVENQTLSNEEEKSSTKPIDDEEEEMPLETELTFSCFEKEQPEEALEVNNCINTEEEEVCAPGEQSTQGLSTIEEASEIPIPVENQTSKDDVKTNKTITFVEEMSPQNELASSCLEKAQPEEEVLEVNNLGKEVDDLDEDKSQCSEPSPVENHASSDDEEKSLIKPIDDEEMPSENEFTFSCSEKEQPEEALEVNNLSNPEEEEIDAVDEESTLSTIEEASEIPIPVEKQTSENDVKTTKTITSVEEMSPQNELTSSCLEKAQPEEVLEVNNLSKEVDLDENKSQCSEASPVENQSLSNEEEKSSTSATLLVKPIDDDEEEIPLETELTFSCFEKEQPEEALEVNNLSNTEKEEVDAVDEQSTQCLSTIEEASEIPIPVENHTSKDDVKTNKTITSVEEMSPQNELTSSCLEKPQPEEEVLEFNNLGKEVDDLDESKSQCSEPSPVENQTLSNEEEKSSTKPIDDEEEEIPLETELTFSCFEKEQPEEALEVNNCINTEEEEVDAVDEESTLSTIEEASEIPIPVENQTSEDDVKTNKTVTPVDETPQNDSLSSYLKEHLFEAITVENHASSDDEEKSLIKPIDDEEMPSENELTFSCFEKEQPEEALEVNNLSNTEEEEVDAVGEESTLSTIEEASEIPIPVENHTSKDDVKTNKTITSVEEMSPQNELTSSCLEKAQPEEEVLEVNKEVYDLDENKSQCSSTIEKGSSETSLVENHSSENDVETNKTLVEEMPSQNDHLSSYLEKESSPPAAPETSDVNSVSNAEDLELIFVEEKGTQTMLSEKEMQEVQDGNCCALDGNYKVLIGRSRSILPENWIPSGSYEKLVESDHEGDFALQHNSPLTEETHVNNTEITRPEEPSPPTRTAEIVPNNEPEPESSFSQHQHQNNWMPTDGGNNVRFYYERPADQPYDASSSSCYHPSQISFMDTNKGYPMPNNNFNILYAAATAQAERNDDESGPPLKIRVLCAEALGFQQGSEPSDQRLFYTSTTPNQEVQNLSMPRIQLAPPAVIHPSAPGCDPMVNMLQYSHDPNSSVVSSMTNGNQCPVQISYANGITHIQTMSDHPDRPMLMERAREARNLLPQMPNHFNNEMGIPEAFSSPIFNNHTRTTSSHHREAEYYSHSQYSPQGDMQHCNRSSTKREHYDPLRALAAEAARRLGPQPAEYDAAIRAAAAIAAVGEAARKRRQEEQLEREERRRELDALTQMNSQQRIPEHRTINRGPRKNYLSHPSNYQD